jgi:hypothetical protein
MIGQTSEVISQAQTRKKSFLSIYVRKHLVSEVAQGRGES